MIGLRNDCQMVMPKVDLIEGSHEHGFGQSKTIMRWTEEDRDSYVEWSWDLVNILGPFVLESKRPCKTTRRMCHSSLWMSTTAHLTFPKLAATLWPEPFARQCRPEHVILRLPFALSTSFSFGPDVGYKAYCFLPRWLSTAPRNHAILPIQNRTCPRRLDSRWHWVRRIRYTGGDP